MPILVEAGPETTVPEGLVLDGLDLQDHPFCIEEFGFNPSKKLWEWVKGADSNGARLLREPLHDNAEMDLTLRIEQQAAMDSALGYIGLLADKLQEAERVSAGGLDRGLEIEWTPAGSSFSQTWYVQGGEIEEIPKDMQDSGWPFRSPKLKVKLYLHPFGYGDEVTGTAVASSDPLLTLTVADVPGDVAAEGRLVVSDTASQNRDYVAFGLEQRAYNSSTSLLIDSASLVTSGYAGAQTTRTGAYSANGVVRATLGSVPVIAATTAELPHVGTFRVFARVWATAADAYVQLAHRTGRNQFSANRPVKAATSGAFCEVDLGTVTITEAMLGTQTWQGRIEAYAAAAGSTLDIDYLMLIPTEAFGKARTPQMPGVPSSFVAHDDFSTLADAAVLHAHTAAGAGGAWATSGAGADFVGESAGGTYAIKRVSADARVATLGTGADMEASVEIYSSSLHDSMTVQLRGRELSAGANIILQFDWSDPDGLWSTIRLYQNGTDLLKAFGWPIISKHTWYELRLRAIGAELTGWVRDMGGTILARVNATTSRVNGNPWALRDSDFSGGNAERQFRNYTLFPAIADHAISAAQSCEFRAHGEDAFLREDSTGTYWGRGPSEARGGRFWLPPAGTEDRVSRVAVFARRRDIETEASSFVADGLTAQVKYRPRFITPPRV